MRGGLAWFLKATSVSLLLSGVSSKTLLFCGQAGYGASEEYESMSVPQVWAKLDAFALFCSVHLEGRPELNKKHQKALLQKLTGLAWRVLLAASP